MFIQWNFTQAQKNETCRNMDGTVKHTNWDNPGTERQMAHGLSYENLMF